MSRPLSNIKVIDLTRALSGPFCTMVLGDLGAEVIKIEMPGEGDQTREIGPFINGMSAHFMSINRSKKSVELNLKDEQQRRILIDLVKEADVLVENFRPGVMERLGLGYEVLKEQNPGLIYAACSGFGTGPYKNFPAYDLIVQALGGVMSITGQPNDGPIRVGSSIGDITAGVFTVVGILAALQERKNSGRGQKVDVAMLDCQVAILENALARYLSNGAVPEPIGNRHPSIAPCSTYPTKDGVIVIAAGNQTLWEKLCQSLECPELLTDSRFNDNASRSENWVELENLLSQRLKSKTTSEWLKLLEKEGIPCAPINDVKAVAENPQVLAREMIVELDHPIAGRIKEVGIPIKFSRTPCSIERPAPTLGEHNDEVLGELARKQA